MAAWARQARAAALRELRPGLAALRRGLEAVVPRAVLALLKPQELRVFCCGEACSAAALRAILRPTQDLTATSPRFVLLLDLVARLTAEERGDFLRFCTGNERISGPTGLGVPGGELAIFVIPINAPNSLPRAHACAMQLMWPAYDSVDEALRLLRIALTFGDSFGAA